MQRDQRVQDNHALAVAQKTAESHGAKLLVAFNLVPGFPGATYRAYDCMLHGLEEVEAELRKLGIPFVLLLGDPVENIDTYVRQNGIGGVITDFNPVRVAKGWKDALQKRLEVPFVEVDAHNVVPAWEFESKREFAARTIRPRIHAHLAIYLGEPPSVHSQTGLELSHPVDWKSIRDSLTVDRSVGTVERFVPGPRAALERLAMFVENGLQSYSTDRNDPSLRGTSELSPYLHFGHISAERIAYEVKRSDAPEADKEAFLEELIVRRELSDNYCLTVEEYDRFEAFPEWARKTLDAHRGDARPYLYDLETFEFARTHDPIWNAAQNEMRISGRMHGYMRMYWAKKILEWTENPEQALEFALYLNDRYQLDGRDPNGYVGVAWSIGGLHDRPWFDRPVYGTVRYMNDNGIRSKFDIDPYVKNWTQ